MNDSNFKKKTQVEIDISDLNDPDVENEVILKIIDDKEMETYLANSLMVPEIMSACADWILPESFIYTPNRELVRLAYDFYQENEKPPNYEELKIELIKKYQGSDSFLLLNAQLDTFEWNTHFTFKFDWKATIKLLACLTKRALTVRYVNKELDAVKRFDFKELEKIKEAKADAIYRVTEALTGGSDLSCLINGNTYFDIVENQMDEWIIENCCEVGDSVMFSGLPYSGKSTLLCYLFQSLTFGTDFFGESVITKTPILYINADSMKEKILGTKLRRLIGEEDLQEFKDNYFYLTPENMPKVITPDFLKRVVAKIRQLKGLTEEQPVSVFVDTIRSAYMGEMESGAENDPVIMSRYLKSIRRMAKENKILIFNLHHNNKGKNEYSGSTSILGATDGYWNLTRDEDSDIAELYRKDRHEVRRKIKYQFNPLLGFVEVKKTTEKKVNSAVSELFEHWEGTESKSLSEICEITGKGTTSTLRIISEAETAGEHPRLEQITKPQFDDNGNEFWSKANPRRWVKV